ncbi:hypothetical protein AAFF_G00167900 [Aldrovandia affinis]|uniref:Uncharacterized protein n=1 Tax=Aldrovandia affinis TaxID=143900 RepID=A0AAD7RM22_9TELE|nr:hypothetical protein AAFF_G00167900 [Aldrovandia affinis]
MAISALVYGEFPVRSMCHLSATAEDPSALTSSGSGVRGQGAQTAIDLWGDIEAKQWGFVTLGCQRKACATADCLSVALSFGRTEVCFYRRGPAQQRATRSDVCVSIGCPAVYLHSPGPLVMKQ